MLKFAPEYVPAHRTSGDSSTEDEPRVDRLVKDTQSTLGEAEAEGWEVVPSSEVLRGVSFLSMGTSYGCSTTAAIVVILRRDVSPAEGREMAER